MENPYFERLSEANFKCFVELHEKVYKRQNAGSYLRRKYSTDYLKIKYLGFLAFDQEGQPIAFYGCIPYKLTIGGRVVRAAQSSDTMTSAEHRRRGLSFTLALKTYQLLRDSRIELVFGFPNQNSINLFEKLGWTFATPSRVFKMEINTLPFFAINRIAIFRNWYAKYAYRILRRYISRQDVFRGSVLEEGWDGVVKDSSYFLYKNSNDKFILEIEGCLIWISIRNGFTIGDILVENEEGFDYVLRKIKSLAAWLGVQRVNFITSEETRLYNLFGSRMDSEVITSLGYLAFNEDLNLDRMRITYADYDTF